MSDSTYEATLAPRARRQSSRRTSLRALNRLAPIAVAAALIAMWQLWVRLGNVPTGILPAPSTVGVRLWDHHAELSHAAWISIKEIIVGFGLATIFAVGSAIMIFAIRPIRLTLYPLLVGSQVIPKIAIAPLIFIWFGLTDRARIIIVVLLAFFPIVIACISGFESIEPAKIYLTRSTGAGNLKTFMKVRIPQALPYFFDGLKLAAARTVGAVIVAEVLSVGNGIGNYIFLQEYNVRPDIALAGVAYLIAIGLALFYLVMAAQRLLIPWHISVRGDRR